MSLLSLLFRSINKVLPTAISITATIAKGMISFIGFYPPTWSLWDVFQPFTSLTVMFEKSITVLLIVSKSSLFWMKRLVQILV